MVSSSPVSLFSPREHAQAAKRAARLLASASTAQKNKALVAMAKALRAHEPDILAANEADLANASELSEAMRDRLRLDPKRLEAMAKAVAQVAKLPDPIGEVTEKWKRPNGLGIEKVRLPLGVVLMIYEARPNVTSDAAALCLKSGNACVLRGGKEAKATNQAIARALAEGLAAAKLPPDAVTIVQDLSRETMLEWLKLDGLVDLCIPRGGEGLIRFVAENARVPVVKHYQGVCHVYLHKDADPTLAERITVNAKASRPGVCNAAECLLVDAAQAKALLPKVARALVAAKVELRPCERSAPILEKAQVPFVPASAQDFGHEFLSLVMAVKVVDGLDGALAHIAEFGSEHTEAIVTTSKTVAARFTREVCASAVMVNASTRFNDGGELGFGAEIGISTSRLHAFGPMGLRELTAQKYVVRGRGQIRG